MRANLFIIATNRYKGFVPTLIEQVKKYFLPTMKVNICLFTDDTSMVKMAALSDQRTSVWIYPIPSYGYPEATMFRFRIFLNKWKFLPQSDYTFYIDADMKICDYINEDILEDIVVVLHPGYFNNKNSKGTWEERKESSCYTKPEHRVYYCAGGFSGGKTDNYFNAISAMKQWIENDLKNGITPIWHDESALNCWLAINAIDTVKILSPEYCCPEPISKRIAWGINHFTPKILALEKPKNFRE